MILLDTNILVDLHRYTFNNDETYAASILSRAELEFGIRQAATSESRRARTQRLSLIEENFEWLHFDLAATISYGELASHAAAQGVTGSRVRTKDALIAAQAHRHGASLMTCNLSDFVPFPPLIEVLVPTDRSPGSTTVGNR
ncbi:MAG: PIN domain-containing protein [Nesterenkonia sp.]